MKFFIACTPRSGSTLLAHSLNLLDGFRVLDEVTTWRGGSPQKIRPEFPIEVERERTDPDRPTLYRFGAKLLNLDLPVNLKTSLTADQLQDVARKFMEWTYRDSDDVHVGFKFLQQHAEELMGAVSWLCENKVHVIFLRRDDKVAQAVSQLTTPFKGKCNVRTSDIIKRTADNKNRDEWLRNAFSDLPSISMSYEQMTGGVSVREMSASASDLLCDFFGIERCTIRTPFGKYSPDRLEDRVSNLSEIRSKVTIDG